LHPFPIDFNAIALGSRNGAQGCNLTIDAHPPSRNQGFGMATRGNPPLGQNLLEALGLFRIRAIGHRSLFLDQSLSTIASIPYTKPHPKPHPARMAGLQYLGIANIKTRSLV
jgi:hypothetical protein